MTRLVNLTPDPVRLRWRSGTVVTHAPEGPPCRAVPGDPRPAKPLGFVERGTCGPPLIRGLPAPEADAVFVVDRETALVAAHQGRWDFCFVDKTTAQHGHDGEVLWYTRVLTWDVTDHAPAISRPLTLAEMWEAS